MIKRTSVLAVALAVGACSEPGVPVGVDDGFGPEHETVTDIRPAPVDDIDFLFVIDSSGSMAEEQAAFARNTRDRLIALLDRDFQSLPNIHIGVISSDVGTGRFNVSGCDGDGDDGTMQRGPSSDDCFGSGDAFIYDVDDGAGGRSTNYAGSLGDAFACVAELGINGCGFEQPLESMRRALSPSNSSNAGFLRPDAMLAIVFLTDEDDCSAFGPHLFDPTQYDITDPLGPMSSFRCFEFGVVCDGDTPRVPGGKEHCRPREDSPYVRPVGEYVDFINAIKPDPSKVVVGAMFGGAGPVVVGTDELGNPVLQATCASELGQAVPSPRLDAFVRSFPGRFSTASICSDDRLATEAYRTTATATGTSAQSPCLLGELAVIDSLASGLSYDCRVYDAIRRGAPDETRTPIAACTDTDDRPCYELRADPACDFAETGLAVDVVREPGAEVESHVLVRCATPTLTR